MEAVCLQLQAVLCIPTLIHQFAKLATMVLVLNLLLANAYSVPSTVWLARILKYVRFVLKGSI